MVSQTMAGVYRTADLRDALTMRTWDRRVARRNNSSHGVGKPHR